MSKRSSDKTIFTDFFREEAEGMLGFQGETENGKTPRMESSLKKEPPKPVLPVVSPAPESERKNYWRSLRAFFRSGKGGALPAGKNGQPPYPALLHRYRDQSFIQRGFPCWVATTGDTEGYDSFYSLYQLLEQAVQQFAPEPEQAKILKDNLLRLEVIIREKVRFADGVYEAAPVFREALEDLKTQLHIKGSEGESFAENLGQLHRHLPSKGVLLPDSPQAPLYLTGLVMQRHLLIQREAWKAEIAQVINQLNDILAVEREKSPESHTPEHLHDALDFADSYLNFDELSSVLPDEGSEAMPAERQQRIEKILDTLQRADELLFHREASVVLTKDSEEIPEIDWAQNFSHFDLQEVSADEVCRKAGDTFDQLMEDAATLFAALRIGKLEVRNEYLPEVHGNLFAHFDWRRFSEQELSACPFVLLLAGASQLVDEALTGFSHLLASNRPVKILAPDSWKQVAAEADESDVLFRQEPGAMAIAHRNTFVLQSAGTDAGNLYEGFNKGIAAGAPALFHLLTPAGRDTGSAATLWTSAAVEGRAFPGFAFDSLAGPKWGNRFDIQNNPQPEADWPQHSLALQTKSEKETEWILPFTFADFAALDDRFAGFFTIVPPKYWNEDLVPLAEYLRHSGDELLAQVPYIWLVDDEQRLQRAAVAWPLVLACQERLDFWRYLQENAGIHSYHVEQATEQLRQEIEAAAEARIADLLSEHETALEEAREKAARAAMDNLAAMLLDMESDATLLSSEAAPPAKKTVATPESKSTPAPEKTEAPEKTPEPEAKEEVEMEELTLGEAWVETPLCTSCNECIDTNKKIFQYDANKQAYVADPQGGPFADIVKAAEKCPVGIIHPGAPQDPSEPDLEKWIARAEPFQA